MLQGIDRELDAHFYHGEVYNQKEDLHEGEENVCTRWGKTIKSTIYSEYFGSDIHPHPSFH